MRTRSSIPAALKGLRRYYFFLAAFFLAGALAAGLAAFFFAGIAIHLLPRFSGFVGAR
jgi:hypothetical protein